MINVFENEPIYGSSYEEYAPARPLTDKELARLNVHAPGIVFMGNYQLSCKLFIEGSTTQYMCKTIDTRSTVSEGQSFDVRKVKVSFWKKPVSSEIKIKVLIPDDAILR